MGKNKLTILAAMLLLAGIFLVGSQEVAAACSLISDKTSYKPGESPQIIGQCDAGNEKNRAYTILLINSTGTNFENFTGTTPSDSSVFLNNFVINITTPTPGGFNATMTGQNLEGFVNATIIAAGANDLILSDFRARGTFTGRSSSLDIDVADENGKKITGGECSLAVKDPGNDENLITIGGVRMINGDADFTWLLGDERFREAKDYNDKVDCFCGLNVTSQGCFDEDGLAVFSSSGSAEVAFTTSSWILFNEDPLPIADDGGARISNVNLTAGLDDIHIIFNVTQNNPLGEPISVSLSTFLINNDTGKRFGEVNEGRSTEGSRAGERADLRFGNSTALVSHKITEDATTGLYFIRAHAVLTFKDQFTVAEYIKSSEPFNVTSLNDTFTINRIETHDFFGKETNLSSTRSNSAILPLSNFTDPFILATEGFRSEFCVNGTNNRADEVDLWINSIILENPNNSITRSILDEFVLVGELEGDSTSEICVDMIMPDDLPTHSDYRFRFGMHLGTAEEPITCEEVCEFEGHGDFFYVAAIEDMVVFDKFITAPTGSSLGNPGVQIVTDDGTYLNMFDDYNYTDQVGTEWNNNLATCFGKDSGASFQCNLSAYPSAGQDIRVCFEGRNYFSGEIFPDFFNIYLDRDAGDEVINLVEQERFIQNGMKSITNSDLYISQAPSREREADGLLVDGYATLCLPSSSLPDNTFGGNDWDVQGDIRLPAALYNLERDLRWTFESDEFPIYGKINTQPTWNLHLFEPRHYNVPELWTQDSPGIWKMNLTLPAFSNNVNLFNFGEHFPQVALEGTTSFERVQNYSLAYAHNGSTTEFSTSLTTQFGEIIILINNINLTRSDNNFTISINTTNERVTAVQDQTSQFILLVARLQSIIDQMQAALARAVIS